MHREFVGSPALGTLALFLIGCTVPTGVSSDTGPYQMTALQVTGKCATRLPCTIPSFKPGDSTRVYWETLWLNADSTYTLTAHYAAFHAGAWAADTTTTTRGDFWLLGRSVYPGASIDSLAFYPANFMGLGEPISVGVRRGDELRWEDHVYARAP